jgi:hypothetical protein
MITPKDLLQAYQAALASLRREDGRVRNLPPVSFFLFGMGPRRKLIYRDGVLKDALSGEILRCWDVDAEVILPPEYAVYIQVRGGQSVRIVEDEVGVWLDEGGRRQALSQAHCAYPPLPGIDTRPSCACCTRKSWST